VTSQPPPLIPSSLTSIDRLDPVADPTPQISLLLQLTAAKEMNTAGPSLYEFIIERNTFIAKISEDKIRHTYKLNLQNTTAKPNNNLESQNTFQNGESMNNNTPKRNTESDRDLHMRENSTHTLSEPQSGRSIRMTADVDQQKETPETAMTPESKESAPTESLSELNNSHLQPNYKERNSNHSADNAVGLPRDIPIYKSEGKANGMGITFNIVPSDLDLTTSGVYEFHSTKNMFSNEEILAIRVKRSNSLQAAQQNSLPLHHNASFDIMEPLVDWGGVS
jgi:hypothetical protein